MKEEVQRRIQKRAAMINDIESKVADLEHHVLNLEVFATTASKEAKRNVQAKISVKKRLIENYNEQILIETEYLHRLERDLRS